MSEMTHLSLFSGIGGLDLAAEWAGFRTIGQCEWEDYPTRVLEKHWPDVPRWRDIKTLTKESFHERTGFRTVDIVSGGFPCQPFSLDGKQKGKEDARYLWPEMLRIIRELTPRWVIGENVPGILHIAAADVIKDLECTGYDVVVFDFEAAAVGAPHRRERIAFVANAKSQRCKRFDKNSAEQSQRPVKGQHCAAYRKDVPARDWSVESDVGRVADGVPHRVDRLKCLGNAVVPQQFYPIFKAIAEIEMQKEENDERKRDHA